MRLDAAGASDRGGRDHNEDAFFVDPASGLFVVADGMGGLPQGEVASRLAVETVVRDLTATTKSPRAFFLPGRRVRQPAGERLTQAFSRANEAVFTASRARFGLGYAGMGTTLVGLLWDGDGFALANVGDSRAYAWRRGNLTQLSQDHSLVMERVRQGLLSPEEAARSPERHILTRGLGLSATVDVDLTMVPARPGDRFLLCSDGLTDVLDPASLAVLLARDEPDDLPAVCRELVETALDLLARDNVTVVLVAVRS